MSRLFDDAQNEYLKVNQAILTVVPLAMVCWFNSDEQEEKQCLMTIVDESTNDGNFSLQLYEQDVIALSQHSSIGWSYAQTIATYSINTWQHGCAIFVSSTDRRAFLNGGSKGTDNGESTPANLDITSIGYRMSLNPYAPMSGQIAEAAIWDLSVWPGATASDKADNFEKIIPSLAKGFSPLFYPLGLKVYWPLIRNANDKVGGYNLT